MKALCIILFLLACLSLNAQACFGIDDTPTVRDFQTVQPLTAQEKQTFRLYPSAQPLAWYDFSTYRFKGQGKRAVWITYAAAGILHGGREAYHAEPAVFEKRFGVAPLSFFGSQQWKRQYYNRDPETQPHKPNLWNPVRDYWHFSGAAKNYILIGGAVTIGAPKQPVKYKVIDTLIGVLAFSATASLTYNLLR
jgi:hypothetical protein